MNDPPLEEWPSASPFFDACDFPFELRALRTATAAAPVAAAAAAAFTAVLAPLPLPLPVLLWLVVSFSFSFSFSVIWTPDRQLASRFRSARRSRSTRRAGAAGLTAGAHCASNLFEPLHQSLVDGCEGSGESVGPLADLVGDLNQALEVDTTIPELRAQLADELLEIVGQLLHIFERCHRLYLLVSGRFFRLPGASPPYTS